MAKLLLSARPNAHPSNGELRILLYFYSFALLPIAAPLGIVGLTLRAFEYKTRHRCKQLVNLTLADIAIKDRLHFFTYNVALGPDYLNVRNGVMSSRYRINAIIEKISQYIDRMDGQGIVVCQEVWSCYEELIRALAQKFKYIHFYIGRGADSGFLTDMDSGLLVASNHPLKFIGYHLFQRRNFLQSFTGRGTVEFCADYNGHGTEKVIGIFGTHLESCDDDGTADMRYQQLNYILGAAAMRKYDANIVVGDLNISKCDESGCEKAYEPALDLIAEHTDDFLANTMAQESYSGPMGSFFNMGLVAPPTGRKSSFSKSTVTTPKFLKEDVATSLIFDRVLAYPKGVLEGKAHICDETHTVEDDYGNKSAPSDHLPVAAEVRF